MCITSYAYKGVFPIEERSEDVALSKAETGRVEQRQNSKETPLVLRLRVCLIAFCTFRYSSISSNPRRVEIEQKLKTVSKKCTSF